MWTWPNLIVSPRCGSTLCHTKTMLLSSYWFLLNSWIPFLKLKRLPFLWLTSDSSSVWSKSKQYPMAWCECSRPRYLNWLLSSSPWWVSPRIMNIPACRLSLNQTFKLSSLSSRRAYYVCHISVWMGKLPYPCKWKKIKWTVTEANSREE